MSNKFKIFPKAGEFVEALNRIQHLIHKTPVVTSAQADERSGRRLFFKAENLQKAGSFKVRGALNAILNALECNPATKGVITHSSGNHGQAVAWASRQVGLVSYVVVPHDTTTIKKNAIRDYGGNVVECGPLPGDRFKICEKIRQEKGLELVPSCDHRDVIAGQGTVALELLNQVPNLDSLLVPVSAGGLASGIAAAAKHVNPEIKTYLVTPKGSFLEECLQSGERPWLGPPEYMTTSETDGIQPQQQSLVMPQHQHKQPFELDLTCGEVTTPTLVRLVEKDVFDMNDDEIVHAMRFSFERMKLVVEAEAGASIAAAFSERFKAVKPGLGNVGVILCGGNLDIDNLPW